MKCHWHRHLWMLLAFIFTSTTTNAAGIGYPEYKLSFGSGFYFDGQKITGGEYILTIAPPGYFGKSYTLYISDGSPDDLTDLKQKALATFPLLCSKTTTTGVGRFKAQSIPQDSQIILFLQFPEHASERLLVSCIGLIEAN